MEETIVSSIFSQSLLNIRSISFPQKWGIYMDVWQHQAQQGNVWKIEHDTLCEFFKECELGFKAEGVDGRSFKVS